MKPRALVGQAVTAVLLLIVVALLIGQVLGQPVLLGFVETGSMAPTLQPGDGFVAIPAGLAGEIEPGDVVVFDAERLHGGGLVTHRVVEETEEGFTTKGDANPFTDQASDENEPPVQREQIVAVAWQVGGSVVVVPKVGLLVITVQGALSWFQQQLAIVFGTRSLLGTQGLAYLLLAVGILAYLGSVILERRRGTQRRRDSSRDSETFNATLAIVTLTVVLVAILTASMVIPGGTQKFEIVSSDSDAPGARVIPKGQSENTTYTVPSNGIVPVNVFLEPTSDRIEVSPRELHVPSGRSVNATVTLHAPPQTGFYRLYLVEHRYFAVIPQATTRALYQLHPWMPILVIDALLAIAFAGLGAAMIGVGRIRVDNRSRDIPLSRRIKRWLR